MNISKVIVPALIAAFVLTSCQTADKTGGGTDLSSVKWETVTGHQTYTHPELKDNDLGAAFKADIKLTFPDLEAGATPKGRSFLDSVSSILQKRLILSDSLLGRNPRETIDRFIEMRRTAYISDFETAKKEGYSDELLSGFVSEIIMEDSVTFNSHNLFSIQTVSYEYTGGAHGMQTTSALTFDFSKETQLHVSSLFKPGSIAQIDSLIIQNILAQNNAETEEELEELGFFDYTEAKATDNLLLTDDGVTFVYNPYEIAAYFVGTVFVKLPYSALTQYLSDEYAFLGK